MNKKFDEMTPNEKFRYDNFAAGKASEEVLNAANPGVLAWLSECYYYESELQKAIARGEKWIYSNRDEFVPQRGSFEDMVESGHRGTNCSLPQAWGFVELDVIHDGGHIWGDLNGELARIDKYGKYLGAVCDIMRWKGKYEFRELYKMGKVKPGDTFYVKGHTFIYMGDEIFMAAGHDGKWHRDETVSTITEDGNLSVFESWIKDIEHCHNSGCSVYYQFRFKDEYMPRFYRNAEGKLIPNPAYKDELNIEYKEGVSPEVPSIIEMVD